MSQTSTTNDGNPGLVQQLEALARAQPDEAALTFLEDAGGERIVTYGELDRQARRLAAALASRGQPGDRVLVVFDGGPEFAFSVWGALYAGMVAVPADPPGIDRLTLNLVRLRTSWQDAGATLALVSQATLDFLEHDPASAELVTGVAWIVVSGAPAAADPAPADLPSGLPVRTVGSHPVALLYTSGSTGTPKGTMIRHAMIDGEVRRRVQMRKASAASGGKGQPAFDVEINWLPMSHATNFLNLFENCLGGTRAIWMTPQQFMRSPMSWLRTIARLSPRKVKALAPNFALDWCVTSTTPADRASLDLSNFCLLVSVGERIRPETVRAFMSAFEPARLQPVLLALYGSTETGLVALAANTRSVKVSRRALEAGVLEMSEDGEVELQSSGAPVPGVEVLVVDPETREPMAPNRSGEIWVRNGTVRAGGYWNREDENERQFRARTAAGDGPFFRTGDLGAFHAGELFVVGRRKQVIIIRGQKHYAEDLEQTVEKELDWIRVNSTIAFADDTGGESLLLAVEVPAGEPDLASKAERIRAVVAEQFGVRVHEVLFVARGDLPRTNTGKVSRNECRQLFREGRLGFLERHGAAPAAETVTLGTTFDTVMSERDPNRRGERIAACMKTLLAGCAQIPIDSIRTTASFREHGIDSATGIRFRARLDAWVGRQLPTSLLYSYPSIEAVSRYLAVGAAAPTDGSDARVRDRATDLAELDVDAMTEEDAAAALEAYLDDDEKTT